MRICSIFLSAYIASISLISTPAQAASQRQAYDRALTIAAIGLNLPYAVHFLSNKNVDLKSRLFYQGDTLASLCNHSLNVLSFIALSSEMPCKYLFLTGATLVGLQTCVYTFLDTTNGVSLVWSGLTGLLLHRLWLQKEVKGHLLLAMLLNSAALVYYACKAPPITTVAHLGGVAAGFGLSFLIPYKKCAIAH